MCSRLIARNIALLVAGLLLATACAADQAAARQEALLNVGQGQIPNDTGSDGATTMTIEECKELGGKALKVVFAKGDSFGDRQARVENWKPFVSLQFNAFNPAQEKVALILTVKHKRTTSFQTRVDFPFTLNPGKNEVKIGIDELTERERLGAGPVGGGQVVLCLLGRSGAHAVLWRYLAGGRRSAGRPGKPAARPRWPGRRRFTTSGEPSPRAGRSHGDARGARRGRPGEAGHDRRRPRPPGPHPRRQDAADHPARPRTGRVRRSGWNRARLTPGG